MVKSVHGENVRAKILRTGLDLWRNGGAAAVSARAIGRVLGLTHAGVLYHFPGKDAIRCAVGYHAVAVRDSVVVPQLIVTGHPAAAALTPDERAAYLAHL